VQKFRKKNWKYDFFYKFPPFPKFVAPNPSGNLVRIYISELRSFIIQFVTCQPSAGGGCNSSVIPADGLTDKKNGLDVDLISQTIYLPIGTNNQQSFSSLLRSHHMRILLQHSFRTKQHSVKDWSDKLPDQQIRQTSLWSCFRQQFHLHHRIVFLDNGYMIRPLRDVHSQQPSLLQEIKRPKISKLSTQHSVLS